MDPKVVGFGALIGALSWEVIRQLISTIVKRAQDSKDLRRKLLREDIELITGLVCEILEASVVYYATEFGNEKAVDISKQIKAKSKTAGMKLAAVNIQLAGYSTCAVEVRLWTAFKYAAAKHLDVVRADKWLDEDSRLNDIYKAAHHLHSSLNVARYANI